MSDRKITPELTTGQALAAEAWLRSRAHEHPDVLAAADAILAALNEHDPDIPPIGSPQWKAILAEEVEALDELSDTTQREIEDWVTQHVDAPDSFVYGNGERLPGVEVKSITYRVPASELHDNPMMVKPSREGTLKMESVSDEWLFSMFGNVGVWYYDTTLYGMAAVAYIARQVGRVLRHPHSMLGGRNA